MSNTKNKNVFKAGLFIIFSLLITFYGILWLRYFSITPAMNIIITFTNSGPMSKGIQVYFKGISVGRVSDINYSKDFTNTLVYIDIYKKDVKIPKNSFAEIKTEGITGQKYIDLEPPANIIDGELISNGDILKGKPKYDLNDIANMAVKEINSGKIDKMMTSIQNSLENTEKVTKSMAEITDSFNSVINGNKQNISQVTENIDQASKNLLKSSKDAKDIMEDKKIMGDIKTSIKNIKNITDNVNGVVSDQEMQKSLKHSISTTNGLIQKFDTNSDSLIFDTLKNTNCAAQKVNTLSCQTSELLSKRFLLLRLLFGRPGKDFQTCFKESQGKCNK
jgi:ABC-type transporter Mla subunit MlaD